MSVKNKDKTSGTQGNDELSELKKQLAEKETALAESESENSNLTHELKQSQFTHNGLVAENRRLVGDLENEKYAREELEAENRKLDEHAAQVEKSEQSRQKKERRIKINIAEGEGAEGKDDVFVSVQAVPYQIKRGVDVEVPESAYMVLKDAAYTVYDEFRDGDEIEYRERQVPRFNFRIIE